MMVGPSEPQESAMKQLLIGIVAVSSLVALGWALPAPNSARENDDSVLLNKAGKEKHARLLFAAILEGLYTDGVQNDVVDMVLGTARDNQTAPAGFSMHFVVGCPLCTPAYDAFQTYRAREALLCMQVKKAALREHQKDTFGQGLSKEMRDRILSADAETRLSAMAELTQRWVDRRLRSMRLTADERAAWLRILAEGRKQGMDRLESNNKRVSASGGKSPAYKMTACAFCDGAVGAVDYSIKSLLLPKRVKR